MKNTPSSLTFLMLMLFATLVMFSSCGMIIKSYIRKDEDNIPPNFGKEKTTLLVVSKKNNYNKKVDKIFKKNYSGEYIFIKSDELQSNYKDTVSYQYVISDHVDIYHMTTMSSGGRTSTTSAGSRSFQITDRKTKKVHTTGISSGTSWKKVLKAYLKKLDGERKKNGDN